MAMCVNFGSFFCLKSDLGHLFSPRDAKCAMFAFMILMVAEYCFFLSRLDYAINNKLTPFISMQNHYSLLYREEEREMLPTLKVH